MRYAIVSIRNGRWDVFSVHSTLAAARKQRIELAKWFGDDLHVVTAA
jgi:hypothetical protein